MSRERKKKVDEILQFDITRPYEAGGATIPIAPPLNEANTYSNFSPKVTVSYTPSRGAMVYATYSRGFKSGGYNLGFLAPGFEPETLTNLEIGSKVDFLGGRLRINGALFHYNYKNLQVTRSDNITLVVKNAASAELYGAEVEVTALPTSRLRIDGSAAITKSQFKRFNTFDPVNPGLGELDLRGNRLPYAPSYTVTLGAEYTLPTSIGPFTLRGEANAISKLYFDAYNVNAMSEEAYVTVNAFLNWKSPDDRYYGGLYVRNLTNSSRVTGAIVYGGIENYIVNGAYQPPRTYGIKFGLRF